VNELFFADTGFSLRDQNNIVHSLHYFGCLQLCLLFHRVFYFVAPKKVKSFIFRLCVALVYLQRARLASGF